jgi:hypothetical protein
MCTGFSTPSAPRTTMTIFATTGAPASQHGNASTILGGRLRRKVRQWMVVRLIWARKVLMICRRSLYPAYQGEWQNDQIRHLLIGAVAGALQAMTDHGTEDGSNCYVMAGNRKACNVGDVVRVSPQAPCPGIFNRQTPDTDSANRSISRCTTAGITFTSSFGTGPTTAIGIAVMATCDARLMARLINWATRSRRLSRTGMGSRSRGIHVVSSTAGRRVLRCSRQRMLTWRESYATLTGTADSRRSQRDVYE